MHEADREAPLIAAGYAPQLMATRSIVTSQPDVTCDVCQRRLLRGEQPEIFLAAGEPRTVCELCAPRASHEGWLRETDNVSLSLPAARPRRGRNLFGRLRQGPKPPDATTPPSLEDASYARGSEPYDFLNGSAAGAPEPVPAAAKSSREIAGVAPAPAFAGRGGDGGPARGGGEASESVDASGGAELLQSALDGFNTSEYPRRIAGVARSLGAPDVTVRPVEYLSRAATIVVAWELCWYRYEVDLDNEPAATRLLGQGTELGELAREDRLANAVADEAGGLSMSGS
jgi:hypothetical protein